MRYPAAILLIFLSTTAVFADDEPRRAQVNAATADAFNSLQRQVLSISLGTDLTVERFIDRHDARKQLDALLQTAQQIGGPRWLDEQTVQVRLELDGTPIANLIDGIAERHPKKPATAVHILHDHTRKDISHRIFAAVGTSTAGNAACRLKPDDSLVAWRAVSDKDRRAAIEAARRSAMDHVFDSLRAVEWDGNRHLADAMTVPAVRESVRGWLADRPVTSIEFRDDLEVRISLAALPQDLWPTLQTNLEKQAVVPAPRGVAEWEQLHQQVIARMAPAVGQAVAPAPDAVGAHAPPMVAIPVQPPAWTQGAPVEATGVSGSVGGSKLRTARAAEAFALDGIRNRLNDLSFDQTMTLGEAAHKDAHIEAAITRSLRQARISKVEYDAPQPGAVRVQMQLDPQAVWRAIAGR